MWGPMSGAEPRFAVDKIVQFRVLGQPDWHFGRTRNLSRSGLLFSCNACPEVGCVVEIQLLDADQELRLQVTGGRCLGQVVRRVLMSWPEVVPQVAIRFMQEERATQANKAG